MIKTNFWFKNRHHLIINALADSLVFFILFLYSKSFVFKFPITFFLLLCIWIFNSYVLGRYSTNFLKKNSYTFKNLLSTLSAFFLGIFFYLLFDWISNSFIFDNIYKLNLIIYSILFVIISDLILIFLRLVVFKNKLEKKWILLEINQGENNEFKREILTNSQYKINIVKIEELKKMKLANYEGIIINNTDYLSKELLNELKKIKSSGIMIINLFIFYERYFERIPPKLISDKDIISRDFFIPRNSNSVRLKRIGDIFLASILFLITSPLILLAAILIKIEDNGPVFYSQERNGLLDIPYKVWKLRTMKVNSESKGPQWASKKDPRITSIGKYLRQSRLDELPQLLSVIKGEMSLIGPRPERPNFDMKLGLEIPHYNVRKWIKPGLSGWAQVNYPYTSSVEDSEKKISYDLFYLRNFSFWLDLLIMLKTIKMVLHIKGSSPKR